PFASTVAIQRVALSAWVALVAVGLVVMGFRRAAVRTRGVGLILLGTVALKVLVIDMAEAVASRARSFACPLVVDPVMVSKHGAPLMADDAVDTFVRALLPCAHLVTPNLAEASRLAGFEVRDADGMERAARAIASLGARHVLVKGGHLDGDAMDLLWSDGHATCLRAARIASTHTHGTGCILSASITARLAHGEHLVDAVTEAKRFVRTAIERAPGLGGGCGPIDLFAPVTPPRARPANTPRS
ncbi:MAG: hydroxymethylpyrimidine/phosphomethylpyrimidine kinase family protein, partial [Phycisphaerales bacterium]